MESPIQMNLNAGVQSLERYTKAIEELRDFEKKNLRVNRFRLFCSLIAIALCAALLILVVRNMRGVVAKVSDTADVLTETGEKLSEVADNLNKVDYETLGKSMQAVADVGEETLGQIYTATSGLDALLTNAGTAVENLNNIDIQKLNDGIQRLNDILEPLAKFFNVFH